ncbi:MAG: URC4/urg3 family protein [Rhodospirillaceae bacterium]|nr:URC4/urg3 family protein [Rhodospirillaceae bacterium]MBT6119206.1 URC4/urg3 family protein [Rhodospirillaceae bacterium]
MTLAPAETAATPSGDADAAVAWLRSPEAIRARCGALFDLARAGRSAHFDYRPERLDAAAELVLTVIRDSYPDLVVPYHSRWRHFEFDGIDRWGRLSKALEGVGRAERARARFDLAVVSVLLDAGAGPDWSYREAAAALVHRRSEGLAVASLDMFAAGRFSSDPASPLRADADALAGIDNSTIAESFQASPENPLVGLEGRAGLMRRLGAALRAKPRFFGAEMPRIGNLYDLLAGQAEDGVLPARRILAAVLDAFEDIWPGRVAIGGRNLGDVWRHSAIHADDRVDDPTDGLVPFHKLSQWLSYSLVEPLEESGIRVTGLDELTGLAEYRNGGLFLDTGVIEARDPALATRSLSVDAEPVVEWRALTVCLLDETTALIRDNLGLDAESLPLAKVLEGGTWAAGRRIAREMRADGGPPLVIVSDGTVF